MNVEEFRDGGYLAEVNRRVLHPLGVSLAVTLYDEPTRVVEFTEEGWRTLREHVAAMALTEDDRAALLERLDEAAPVRMRLGPVYDSRDDDEGVCYDDETLALVAPKAVALAGEHRRRATAREAALGYVVQPIDGAL